MSSSTERGSKFLQCKATEKLKELAQTPLDLTKDEAFTPSRIREMVSSACGFKLLYATERVDKATVLALTELADEMHAVEKMHAMQNGDVINAIEGFPSENRSVLHTAARDFFHEGNTAPVAKSAADLAKIEYEKLQVFIAGIEGKSLFTDLIVIGIGGSDLGPRAAYHALGSSTKRRSVHFISNVDPDDASSVLRKVDLKQTLVAVISKSGTTQETLANASIVRQVYLKHGLQPQKHFVSVTGKGGPLDDPDEYLESFYIWDHIGGRFSVTSLVGGVPLAFAFGFDTYTQFLQGAHDMDLVALESDIYTNLPLLGAMLGIWNINFLDHSIAAVIPYSQPLHRFAAHIQQCVMESNGKSYDRSGKRVDFTTGPIIFGEPGTNSQHSFFQLIHQGTQVVPVEFIGFREQQYPSEDIEAADLSQKQLLSNLFAQSLSLCQGKDDKNPNRRFSGNRPSHILLAKKLTPYTLGALLAYYEHKVAFQGFIWDINSWDQEGVQLGKISAKRFLQAFEKSEDQQTDVYGTLCDEYLNQMNGLHE